MKILKIIGIIIGAVIVIVVALILFQPAKGHVEKSIVVSNSPTVVYHELNSFKSFQKWAPWAKMDPDAKYTYEGPDEGVGTKMSWDGEKTGKGSQWIEESVPNERIKTGLSFEGYDGVAYAQFLLAPEGNGTKITWTYDGDNNGFGGKAMWLVMGSMLSGQYEQGLGDLKSYLESIPAPADSTANH